MRLTTELIKGAQAYINPLREREINLRGYKIPAIENLGATEDEYETIDLSDNDIVKLENFPALKRLTSLVLNNNKIEKFSSNLHTLLPNLHTLILTNNRVSELSELDSIGQFIGLTFLSLLNNPVARVSNYRLYLIHKLPKLKLLDFSKVKQKEREAAKRMFGAPGSDKAALTAATAAAASATARSAEPVSASVAITTQLTPIQKQKIMEKIRAASTLEEMERLENILKTGDISQFDL